MTAMPPMLMQFVSFVHPALAGAAAAAASAPLIIHLLNRRRFRRAPWAAMMFLLAANRRSTTRVFLEQWGLLLARMAVVGILGLALARPYFPSGAFAALPASRSHRVLVLDDSLSMRAQRGDGASRFAFAQRVTEDLIGQSPPTDAISVVAMSTPASAVIGVASFDHRAARERIAAMKVTERGTDVAGALRQVKELLAESPAAPENRFVYVLSDFSREAWGLKDNATGGDAINALRQLADALPRAASTLRLLPMSGADAENAAIVSLVPDSTLATVGEPVRVVVEVRNFGERTVRGLRLQVRHDTLLAADVGAHGAELPPIEPGASATAAVSAEFREPGVHTFEARLLQPGRGSGGGNALSEDDARYLSIEVRSSINVLLVDGRPGPTMLSGEGGFLATALEPAGAPQDRAVARVRVITDTELASEHLADHDLLVLCNVARLPAKQWQAIDAAVADGLGLWVFAGDQVAADNYNKFGHESGRGVLPAKFGAPVAVPATDSLTLAVHAPQHPIVRELAEATSSGLFTARVEQYMPLTPDDERAEVVLHYSNEQPAMVASTHGTGRVLMVGTSANMSWNNLAAKGDFVSLMFASLSHLNPPRGAHRNIQVGQPLREALSAADVSQQVRIAASGAAVDARLVTEHDTLLATSGPIESSGLHAVIVGSQSRPFAVNVDPAESDLRAADERTFMSAFGRPAAWVQNPGDLAAQPVVRPVTELAWVAVCSVLALLLFEAWMAMKVSSPRAIPAAL